MKNLLISFILLFFSKASAQNNSTISATQELPNWPALLANLPTGQITSGLLLDKVVDYSNLTNFNTTKNNLSGNKHFIQAMSDEDRTTNEIEKRYFDTS